jgi:hypothetical protein
MTRPTDLAFVDLRVTREKPVVSYTLRFVGLPHEYVEHANRKAVPGKKGEYERVPFPDAAYNPAPTRICTEDHPEWGPCPWCATDYAKRRVFAVNCLDRADNRLKVLRAGITIFRHVAEWENEQEEKGHPHSVLGGELAPDVTISAQYDAEVLGNVRYVVTVHPTLAPITEEEAAVIRAAGTPTPDEADAIYKDNPELCAFPDWFICGFPLDRMFEPAPLA